MRKGFTFALFAFLFSASLVSAQTLEVTFDVTAPSDIARGYEIGLGNEAFGFQFSNGDSYSADLVWGYAYTDSTQVATDSLMCLNGPVANADALAGNIAVIRRGGCFFSDKVQQAQDAGAIAAIICNNAPGDGAIAMAAGGDFEGLDTIPVISLSFEDCAIVADVLTTGETITATIEAKVATFLDAASAYSYHTPQSQIIPLDAMQVTVANASETDPVDVVATATITEPSGNVVTLEQTATLSPFSDSVLVFDAYTPSGELGMYNVEFSSSESDDILSQPFVITEYTYAVDNGIIGAPAAVSDDAFVNTYNLTYNIGSLVLAGTEGGNATHASFGLANAAALYTGDAASDVFNVVLYDADADGDNVLDLNNSFDDLLPVAIGEYVLTGNEGVNELVHVPLLDLGGATATALEAGKPYYITVQYSGLIAGLGVGPAFTTGGGVYYPIEDLTNPLFLDQLYSRWSDDLEVICRLQMEGFEPTVNTFEVLEATKLSVSPNPATDFINVEFDLEEQADNVRIRLLNIEGKLLQSIELDNVTKYNHQLDVQNLAAGTYFLSISTPEGYRAEKFIIAK